MFESFLSGVGKGLDEAVAWVSTEWNSLTTGKMCCFKPEQPFDEKHPCRQRLATKVAVAAYHDAHGTEHCCDDQRNHHLSNLTEHIVSHPEAMQKDADALWNACYKDELHAPYSVAVAKAVLFSSCPRKNSA